jgi:hypothetical protein
MRRFVGVVLLAVVAACSSSKSGAGGGGGGADAGDSVPLMAGFQVIAPIVTDIEAGQSYEYCTWTDITLQQDTWIDASQGFQTETGHHVILFYESTPQPPGTRLCNFEDMAEFQFGMPASGGPGTQKVSLPGNLAIKLPAGSQIVVNHHYLNASATAVAQAQSALDVFYADPSTPHTTSSSMTILNTSMTVPVGASTYTIDCTVNQPYNSWEFFPHMHNWGQHITITDTPASTGVPQQLVDMDWAPDYAFDFSTVATMNDPSKPFQFNTGDKLHIECDYLNDTGAEMTFGDEMCVLNAFTVDPNNLGDWDCDGGHWGQF